MAEIITCVVCPEGKDAYLSDVQGDGGHAANGLGIPNPYFINCTTMSIVNKPIIAKHKANLIPLEFFLYSE